MNHRMLELVQSGREEEALEELLGYLLEGAPSDPVSMDRRCDLKLAGRADKVGAQ